MLPVGIVVKINLLSVKITRAARKRQPFYTCFGDIWVIICNLAP
jgi:hypothetical protein